MPGTVAIVDYRATWPADFRRLATALRSAYGPAALQIDHIGSTAVPGLPAKDVIDVQVTVASLAACPEQLPGFESVPYLTDHAPPGFTGDPVELAKRYFRAAPHSRPAHVHVREAGRLNQRYALLCRDYLRATPDAAAAYAEVKRTLAAHFPDDGETYADVKDPVFDVLMAGAAAWARATGWTARATDA
ncbi:MAG: hypothetical protein QOE98_1628 [Gaiellaceae bacterium]|nr:hypothetical protein [Gaiellaceae bacterium]